MRLALPFALAVLLGACQPAADEAAAPAANPVADPDAITTLRGLTMGDRACYVTVEDAAGETREEMGEFILCEGTALVGQRVRLTYGEVPVPAASCEGDPACTETEVLRIVTGIERAE